MIWMTAHLPFIMGYVLAAASLSRLVLATDCHDANAEDLTEAYISNAQREVPIGLRWFYCGGLGTALLCMSTRLPCLSILAVTNPSSYYFTLPRPQRIRWSTALETLPPSRSRLRRYSTLLPTTRRESELAPINFYHNGPCCSCVNG